MHICAFFVDLSYGYPTGMLRVSYGAVPTIARPGAGMGAAWGWYGVGWG